MRPVPEILVKVLSLIALMLLGVGPAAAQAPAPYGIALEGYAYPYPVQYLALDVQHHAVRLAHMDVVPPVPRERLIEQEDKLTGPAYLQQLITTYGLTLPPEQVQPFVDIRERQKGSAEWPRWVRSFVPSYYAMWGQPVVHELPLVDKQVLLMAGAPARAPPGQPAAQPGERTRQR